jgi:hypothetical protein
MVRTPAVSRIEEVERRIEILTGRMEQLERRVGGAAPLPAAPAETVEELSDDSIFDLSMVGRTIIILGGAWLLRAITQSAVLPDLAGVGIGIAYAFFWLFMADRAAKGGWKPAVFEGGVATAIALAISWESSVRFSVIGSGAAAAIIATTTLLVLLIAAHRSLPLLAWFGSLASVVALLAIGGGTLDPIAPAAALLTIGFAGLLCSRISGWEYLGALPSLQGGIALALIPFAVAAKGASATAGLIVAIFAIVTLGAAVPFLQVRGQQRFPLTVIIHSVVLFPLAAAVSTLLTRDNATGSIAAGAALVIIAGLWYLTARRIPGERENTFFLNAGASILTATGMLMLFDLTVTSSLLGLAAVVAMWRAADRTWESAIGFQAVAWGATAVLGSGLALFIIRAMFAPYPVQHGLSLLSVLAVLIVFLMAVAPEAPATGRARLFAMAMTVAGFASLGASALQVVSSATADAAAAHSVARTVVLSIAAIACAAARNGRLKEARHLVTPLLTIGALKLVGEDLRVGNAVTLFLSFAVYGSTLVAAAKLRGGAKTSLTSAAGT